MIRDITTLKRAEEDIRRSEEAWHAQYKSFPIPTFTWTLAGNDLVLTDFNDAGMALWTYIFNKSASGSGQIVSWRDGVSLTPTTVATTDVTINNTS